MKATPFKKVLVANRGEIAVRIIRACHELGLKTVAIHSTVDADALHVKLASESICIGPAAPRDSYLNIASIMAAAIATRVDAIHPGYGFLSENASFAEICGSCGIAFIGPTVRSMRIMGDKAKARRAAERVGVPTIPGTSKGVLDTAEGLANAKRAGYPVLLKACAGGGGRGMKIVSSEGEFATAFNMAQREVEAAFGDGSLLIEKYLPRVRHIEVQVIGDTFGNLVHAGIRDCSMQRRYQKLIEESPSIGLEKELQERIEHTAIELVASVHYSSVGTVEFLVDLAAGEFYFIEMNTRLQVEHPVTELVTDLDLVKEQILIASGMPLSVTQDDIRFNGHAIEIRINAEDPRNMRPSPGQITNFHVPGGNGIRIDTAIYSGYKVQPYYDSLIAKVIAHAATRDESIAKLLVALDELIIEGIHTNIELHQKILNSEAFRTGDFYTKFLDSVRILDDPQSS
jgi:acetyl-CoA carboxylase biotin carboxylase subunit